MTADPAIYRHELLNALTVAQIALMRLGDMPQSRDLCDQLIDKVNEELGR